MARLHEIIPPNVSRYGYYGGLYISGIPKVTDLYGVMRSPDMITSVVNTIRAEDDPEIVDRMSNYSHYEIPDGKYVHYDLFFAARDDAIDFMAGGHNTLVHCRAGRNRSGTVAALVVLELGYVSNGREAVEYVRERRPRAIANPVFEEWLYNLR